MKMTTTSKYGLIAVGYIATHPQDGKIMAKTIAEQYNIPLEYLLKTLQSLVRAGIVKSKRGPNGGFVIGKAVDEIMLFDIIKAIDGTAASYDIAQQTKNADFAVKMKEVCDKADAEQDRILQATTLAELVGS